MKAFPVIVWSFNSNASKPSLLMAAMALIRFPRLVLSPCNAYPYLRMWFLASEPVNKHLERFVPWKSSHTSAVATCLIFLRVTPHLLSNRHTVLGETVQLSISRHISFKYTDGLDITNPMMLSSIYSSNDLNPFLSVLYWLATDPVSLNCLNSGERDIEISSNCDIRQIHG